MPWLDEGLFDLQSKDSFKENFARAVCCALPSFDLAIIDEAHNLKGGLHSKAWRNWLLALVLGREPMARRHRVSSDTTVRARGEC